MNSQQLLLLNLIILLVLVVYFLTSRPKDKQKPLLDLSRSDKTENENSGNKASTADFKEAKASKDAESFQESQQAPVVVFPIPPIVQGGPVSQEPSGVVQATVTTKDPDLKEIVYFVYNGHEWEAHEVLGIRSGLSLAEVTQHYQKLIKNSDPSTFEFYDAAFAAILRLKRNKW